VETFKRIQNTKKRDSQVMERLWQLQALFMTVRIYRPYMDTGHELCIKAKMMAKKNKKSENEPEKL
jgi:hypothetical protein